MADKNKAVTSCKRNVLFRLSILLFFVSLTASRLALGQYEASRFRLHSVKAGLSYNYVTCIEQDDLGYLWIGTDNGLNRFDGTAFTGYANRMPPLQLPSAMIRNLKMMGPHQMGVVTRQGFQLLNTRNFHIDQYRIPDTTAFGPQRNAAWDAVFLPDSSLALTTATGFYVFDRNRQLCFQHEAFGLKDVGRKRIFYGRYMLPLSPEHLLVLVGEHGLAHYQVKQKVFTEFAAGDASRFNIYPAATARQRGLIHHLQISPDETLFFHFAANSIVYHHHQTGKTVSTPLPVGKEQFSWDTRIFRIGDTSFAVNGGSSGFFVFTFDARTGRIHFGQERYLEAYKILCLKRDRNGQLWIGTSRGLLQQTESSPFISTHTVPPHAGETTGDGFACVYRYRDQLFAGGSSLHTGLLVLDARTRAVRRRIVFFQQPSAWNEISSIERYHGDTLYIGTNQGILWLDTRSFRYGKLAVPASVTQPLNILGPPGNDGYAWMCSMLRGLVARYHIPTRQFRVFSTVSKPALPFEKIKSIARDSYGDVWFGGHSLARWNSRKEIFDTLIKAYGGPNPYNDDILMLTADQRGSLWMHNLENGLLEYRIASAQWVHYGIKDGLPATAFESMSTVTGQYLWIASAGHLTCFDLERREPLVYDVNDGYPEEGLKEKQIFTDTAGKQLYLLARRQLSVFPLQPARHTDLRDDILLQEIRINNRQSLYHPSGTVDLPFSDNNLSLYFTVIDYSHGGYRFQYKLNDQDEWIGLNTMRSITFSGLQPGLYKIYLRAIGKWGTRQQLLTLRIREPWWRSWPFLLSVAALFLLLVAAAYRYRVRRIRQRADLDKKLAHTEMMALHAQMNPHFISNCLNSIREMILNDENQDASRYLTKFAHLIRITLEHSLRPFISLRQTLDYLQRYAEMERIRNAAFDFRQTVAAEIDQDEVMLPPMLIQPFIENAIWHGRAAAGSIDIRVTFRQEQGQLIGVVEDNGIGIRRSLDQKKGLPDLHQSVGIDNVRHRIRLLNEKYSMRSSVLIEDRSDGGVPGETGTRVTITLPLKHQDS